MTDQRPKVVIVGAGVGGITTAAYLSKQGYRVEVYEKNDFIGGRCSLIHNKGFRFDQGPSLLLMPKVFKRCFKDLDEDFEELVDLVKCDPNYVIYFGSNGSEPNKKLIMSTDLTILKSELEAIEPGSFYNFLGLLKESHIHYETSIIKVLDMNFINWYDFFNIKNLSLIFTCHIFDFLYRRVSLYFKSDLLRQAFTFQSMYMGMSPYDAPATYSLLQYTEFAEGIWYPIGGFQSIFEKIKNIAETKYHAKFHYGKGVKKIICDPNTLKATGIELDDGSVIEADIVISNVDLVHTYSKLLPHDDSYRKRVEKLEQTSSAICFYWGMKTKLPTLNGHNIFLSGDYKESFEKIFKEFDLPVQPSFYVHVPSHVDPSAAPEGKDCLMVLCPVGHLNDDKVTELEWQDRIQRAKLAIINVISKRLNIPNFESLIESEVINTPQSWKEKFNLWNGSALGLNHNIFQVCWFRPSNQHRLYKNVYFVGASTHPGNFMFRLIIGTGVPIILCGARNVSKLITENWNHLNTEKTTESRMLFIIIPILVMLISFGYILFNL
ncbi:beta-carotene [Globomyces pollinis-pini]|nr:beta-carotene [Globomyces pollinis-pini]